LHFATLAGLEPGHSGAWKDGTARACSADIMATVYILKNHNGTELGRFTDTAALMSEMLKYEIQTGNTTLIEVVKH
jgi:hypothetical protein